MWMNEVAWLVEIECQTVGPLYSFVVHSHFILTEIIQPWLNLNPARTVDLMHATIRFVVRHHSIHSLVHPGSNLVHSHEAINQYVERFYLIFRLKLCLAYVGIDIVRSSV